MGQPLLFDAVLFDLDGTLVATDRFWVQAARTGTRRALTELGIEREVPGAREWMAMVGRPAGEAFAALFTDLAPAAVAVVRDACFAEERRLLAAGGAALMPGALETLGRLREAGLAIGIASNCTGSYLEHMLEALALRGMVDEARCLDSPGVGNKADMIEQELLALGTRRALMVGDRSLDRDAAWDNGLPHVHCAFGFAPAGEEVAAEGRIEDLGELPALLAGRARWIEAAMVEAGLFRPTLPPPFVVGIDGPVAAGKTLFARDVVELLTLRDIPAAVVGLDAFRRPAPLGAREGDGADPLTRHFDVDALFAEVLDPFARGEPVRFATVAPDRLGMPVEHRVEVPAGAVLVLEGPFLAHPRLRARIDRLLRLEVPEELILRRVAGRDGRTLGTRALEEIRGTALPAHRAFDARHDPCRLADLVLDARNPFGA